MFIFVSTHTVIYIYTKFFNFRIQTGYLSLPCGFMYPLQWTDLSLACLGEHDNPPEEYAISIKAGMC